MMYRYLYIYLTRADFLKFHLMMDYQLWETRRDLAEGNMVFKYSQREDRNSSCYKYIYYILMAYIFYVY